MIRVRGAALLLVVAACLIPASARSQTIEPASWDPARGILIEGATVVTMDNGHTVIPDGRVLIRRGVIAGVWQGPVPPDGVALGNPSVIEAGPQDLLFPGLINIHNHLLFNHLHVWPAPTSHTIGQMGKSGTDAYANRYQWGGGGDPFKLRPPEQRRLVPNASAILVQSSGLDLAGEVLKYAEVAALLGGETTLQGGLLKNDEAGRVLARNLERAFGPRIKERVPRIDEFVEEDAMGDSEADGLLDEMATGKVDAWIVHLAEGVPDDHRRSGDPVSSRAEFDTIAETCMETDASKCLLNDTTVVVHGTALERADFARMRDARSIRVDGTGDRRGAKLVWSPLSNMLLYGETTRVYDALAEGVLVSLSTDWTPSGSRSLLRELKVADVALRDERILGADRELVPAFALEGKSSSEQQAAEDALDRFLVDMVTRNPALTARIYDRVGSIEPGKFADLVLLRRAGQNDTVYRDLIEASEEDLELVIVGGDPIAGDVELLSALKPGDYEVVASAAAGFERAVDVTTTLPVPEADETLAELTSELEFALAALGGDNPPPGGGPGPPGNTYSYLQAHVDGGKYVDDRRKFHTQWLKSNATFLPDGSANIELMQLAPLLPQDNDFLGHLLRGELDANGLIADASPPFKLYAANLNQVGPLGNPFAGFEHG